MNGLRSLEPKETGCLNNATKNIFKPYGIYLMVGLNRLTFPVPKRDNSFWQGRLFVLLLRPGVI